MRELERVVPDPREDVKGLWGAATVMGTLMYVLDMSGLAMPIFSMMLDSLVHCQMFFFVPMPCALEAQTVIKTFCL